MTWILGRNAPRGVDPWPYMGPEAMVAWDRDVAPYLTYKIRNFIVSGLSDLTDSHAISELRASGVSWLVVIDGVGHIPDARGFFHMAAFNVADQRWRTTFDGWRPQWIIDYTRREHQATRDQFIRNRSRG